MPGVLSSLTKSLHDHDYTSWAASGFALDRIVATKLPMVFGGRGEPLTYDCLKMKTRNGPDATPTDCNGHLPPFAYVGFVAQARVSPHMYI